MCESTVNNRITYLQITYNLRLKANRFCILCLESYQEVRNDHKLPQNAENRPKTVGNCLKKQLLSITW